eukprot:scaffold12476_cov64-Attheya_sp.AAC.1
MALFACAILASTSTASLSSLVISDPRYLNVFVKETNPSPTVIFSVFLSWYVPLNAWTTLLTIVHHVDSRLRRSALEPACYDIRKTKVMSHRRRQRARLFSLLCSR